MLCGRHVTKYPVRVERKQSSSSPSGANVPCGYSSVPRWVVKVREVLFADGVHTTAIQPFNLIAVCCLQGCKDGDVTWLELVRSVCSVSVVS